jgi:SAM-dependent methyltransferase
MGLWPNLLKDISDLKRAGLIDRGCRVAEIGQQQLTDRFLCADEFLAEVYELFDAPRVELGSPVGQDNFTDQAPLARRFWQSLGFSYIAIDLVGDDIVRLDLNRDTIPPRLFQSQDLVVNGGTTEHVANQDNAFRCIHDLLRSGGIMLHAVPCQGMMTHGLVNYTLKFFWALCRENNYEALSLRLGAGRERPMERNEIEFGVHFGKPEPLSNPMPIRDRHIVAILRKPHDRAFVTPMG